MYLRTDLEAKNALLEIAGHFQNMARAATVRPLLRVTDSGDTLAIMLYCSSEVRKLPNGDPAMFVDWAHETKAVGASKSSNHLLCRDCEDCVLNHLGLARQHIVDGLGTAGFTNLCK